MPITSNTTTILLISVSLTVSGCSLTLGVSEPSERKLKFSSKVLKKPKDVPYKLVAITPTLVKSTINKKRRYQSRVLGRSAQSGYTYKIGKQDVLTIVVWDHPELTIESFKYPIQADGTFFFPYVGYIKAAGRTVKAIQQEITEKLAETIVKPQVGISITEFRSQSVNITGEVEKPTTMPITDQPLTILNAIAEAGGMTEEADRTNLVLNRNGKTQRINLKELSRNGNLRQNFILKSGDVLHVSKNDSKVFVMGQVGTPKSITYGSTGITLAEALSDANGLEENTANPKGVFILRQEKKTDKKPTVYQLDASSVEAFMLAEQFNLRDRDIVYVTSAGITRFNRVISQLLPTVGLRERFN